MKSACKELKSKIDQRTSKGGASARSSSMATGKSAATSLQFSSAPNSPVFSKRTQNDSISSSSSTHRSTPPQSVLHTSNSMTNNANHFMHTSNSFNRSDSPSSSLSSSSEMNILQELQQHNSLFKVPTVNRSVSVLSARCQFSLMLTYPVRPIPIIAPVVCVRVCVCARAHARSIIVVVVVFSVVLTRIH